MVFPRPLARLTSQAKESRVSYHDAGRCTAGSWDARRGDVHGSAVLVDPDLRDRLVPSRFPRAEVDGLSDRLSPFYDPFAGYHLLPAYDATSAVGLAAGGERSRGIGYSYSAGRKSALSSELHAQCGRSLQRNSVAPYLAGRRSRVRVLGGANCVETRCLGHREHSDRNRHERAPSRCDRRPKLLLRTGRGFRLDPSGPWLGFFCAGFSFDPSPAQSASPAPWTSECGTGSGMMP